MRKLTVWLTVITMLAGCMTACGRTEPEQTLPATQPTQPFQETENEEAYDPIGQEDTYWEAVTYFDEEAGMDGFQPLDPSLWTMDLRINVDGTASFRDIHEGICLMDDSCLDLTWQRSDQEELLFYSVLYEEPILRGSYKNDSLFLRYWGTELEMKQAPLPQTVGRQYSPAELAGTWLLVSGITDGWQWEAMPNELSSIVFKVTSVDGPLVLVADMEQRGACGEMQISSYRQVVQVLQEPLYYECENEDWSVRIGEASQPDANGFPTQPEYYATLLDGNTLLLQQYYTLDGYPVVSYQTYCRFPDLVSWMDYESMELEYSNWSCTGYEAMSGEELPLPAELEDFSVTLGPDGGCYVYFGDAPMQTGTWTIENGGVLLLRGEGLAEETFWFGGVISGYWVETEEESLATYQMVLYYKGGLLKLSMCAYG